ncbi:hypothetical protein HDU93_006274 [Gonapodya sp. JEL0774]|nr:hypothetical protein HDU93_006274 [Gonapodya sp. JEL0774]
MPPKRLRVELWDGSIKVVVVRESVDSVKGLLHLLSSKVPALSSSVAQADAQIAYLDSFNIARTLAADSDVASMFASEGTPVLKVTKAGTATSFTSSSSLVLGTARSDSNLPDRGGGGGGPLVQNPPTHMLSGREQMRAAILSGAVASPSPPSSGTLSRASAPRGGPGPGLPGVPGLPINGAPSGSLKQHSSAHPIQTQPHSTSPTPSPLSPPPSGPVHNLNNLNDHNNHNNHIHQPAYTPLSPSPSSSSSLPRPGAGFPYQVDDRSHSRLNHGYNQPDDRTSLAPSPASTLTRRPSANGHNPHYPPSPVSTSLAPSRSPLSPTPSEYHESPRLHTPTSSSTLGIPASTNRTAQVMQQLAERMQAQAAASRAAAAAAQAAAQAVGVGNGVMSSQVMGGGGGTGGAPLSRGQSLLAQAQAQVQAQLRAAAATNGVGNQAQLVNGRPISMYGNSALPIPAHADVRARSRSRDRRESGHSDYSAAPSTGDRDGERDRDERDGASSTGVRSVLSPTPSTSGQDESMGQQSSMSVSSSPSTRPSSNIKRLRVDHWSSTSTVILRSTGSPRTLDELLRLLVLKVSEFWAYDPSGLSVVWIHPETGEKKHVVGDGEVVEMFGWDGVHLVVSKDDSAANGNLNQNLTSRTTAQRSNPPSAPPRPLSTISPNTASSLPPASSRPLSTYGTAGTPRSAAGMTTLTQPQAPIQARGAQGQNDQRGYPVTASPPASAASILGQAQDSQQAGTGPARSHSVTSAASAQSARSGASVPSSGQPSPLMGTRALPSPSPSAQAQLGNSGSSVMAAAMAMLAAQAKEEMYPTPPRTPPPAGKTGSSQQQQHQGVTSANASRSSGSSNGARESSPAPQHRPPRDRSPAPHLATGSQNPNRRSIRESSPSGAIPTPDARRRSVIRDRSPAPLPASSHSPALRDSQGSVEHDAMNQQGRLQAGPRPRPGMASSSPARWSGVNQGGELAPPTSTPRFPLARQGTDQSIHSNNGSMSLSARHSQLIVDPASVRASVASVASWVQEHAQAIIPAPGSVSMPLPTPTPGGSLRLGVAHGSPRPNSEYGRPWEGGAMSPPASGQLAAGSPPISRNGSASSRQLPGLVRRPTDGSFTPNNSSLSRGSVSTASVSTVSVELEGPTGPQQNEGRSNANQQNRHNRRSYMPQVLNEKVSKMEGNGGPRGHRRFNSADGGGTSGPGFSGAGTGGYDVDPADQDDDLATLEPQPRSSMSENREGRQSQRQGPDVREGRPRRQIRSESVNPSDSRRQGSMSVNLAERGRRDLSRDSSMSGPQGKRQVRDRSAPPRPQSLHSYGSASSYTTGSLSGRKRIPRSRPSAGPSQMSRPPVTGAGPSALIAEPEQVEEKYTDKLRVEVDGFVRDVELIWRTDDTMFTAEDLMGEFAKDNWARHRSWGYKLARKDEDSLSVTFVPRKRSLKTQDSAGMSKIKITFFCNSVTLYRSAITNFPRKVESISVREFRSSFIRPIRSLIKRTDGTYTTSTTHWGCFVLPRGGDPHIAYVVKDATEILRPACKKSVEAFWKNESRRQD